MRTSGRNGPRSQPNATVINTRKDDAFSTPSKSRRAPSGATSYASSSLEKRDKRMDEEEDAESDSEGAWSRRECARRRQIMIGKARPEYQRYIAEIAIEDRGPSQPSTPDPCARVSKRQFDRALGLWRRHLHEFDAVSADTTDGRAGMDADKENIANDGAAGSGRGMQHSTARSHMQHVHNCSATQHRAVAAGSDRERSSRVQTRRYADNSVSQAPADKSAVSTGPAVGENATISLADALQLGDDPLPPAPLPPTAYDNGQWQWTWPMALPPPVEDCQGMQGFLGDPSTPPKHDMQNAGGYMLDGFTPDEKPQKPPRDVHDPFGFAAFQSAQLDKGLKQTQLDFSCAETLATMALMAQPTDQMGNYFGQNLAECHQQMPYAPSDISQPQQQVVPQEAWQWHSVGQAPNPATSMGATASATSEELPAPPPLPALPGTPGTPLTPRKGGRGGGFLAGGHQWMSPGASPAPPAWALETPSPQRFSGFYNQLSSHRESSQKVQQNQLIPNLFLQQPVQPLDENFTYFGFVPRQETEAQTAAGLGLSPNELNYATVVQGIGTATEHGMQEVAGFKLQEVNTAAGVLVEGTDSV